MLVHTKKRLGDLVCTINPQNNLDGYVRASVADVVGAKGVGGLKAYFSAELRSQDELVVKIAMTC